MTVFFVLIRLKGYGLSKRPPSTPGMRWSSALMLVAFEEYIDFIKNGHRDKTVLFKTFLMRSVVMVARGAGLVTTSS